MGIMLHDEKRPGKGSLGSLADRVEHALEVAKSRLGPFRDQAEHALHSARESAEARGHDAYEAASSATSRAGSGLETAASGVSKVVKAIGIAAGVVRAVRAFNDFRGIPWFRPRRSAFGSAAIFTAGACAGAGVALLLTPYSGPELRAKLAQRGEIAKQKAIRAIDLLATQVSEAYSGSKSPEHDGVSAGPQETASSASTKV